MKSIFFTGASGVGKSTLAQWVSESFGLPLRTSTTRAIAASMGGFEKIHADPNQRERFQLRVWEAMLDIVELKDPVVSDRALDCLVYQSHEAQAVWMTNDQRFERFLAKLRDSVIFFVRPDPEVVEEARRTDAGARAKYLLPERVYRTDGAIQHILEFHNVPHIHINGSNWPDRCRTVATVLHLLKYKALPASWARPEVIPGKSARGTAQP